MYKFFSKWFTSSVPIDQEPVIVDNSVNSIVPITEQKTRDVVENETIENVPKTNQLSLGEPPTDNDLLPTLVETTSGEMTKISESSSQIIKQLKCTSAILKTTWTKRYIDDMYRDLMNMFENGFNNQSISISIQDSYTNYTKAFLIIFDNDTMETQRSFIMANCKTITKMIYDFIELYKSERGKTPFIQIERNEDDLRFVSYIFE